MNEKNTILTEIKGPVATIWLNRPQKHNAVDEHLISGFLSALNVLNNSPEIRVICIRGKGPSFSAGADFEWMRNAKNLSPDENIEQCRLLAKCYYDLYKSPKITVCMVHGSCFGGANGFVAAADLSIADEASVFGLPEVRAGLIPATAGPYIIRKISLNHAKILMLTGRKFNAHEALNYGLINKVIPSGNTDSSLDNLIEDLLKGAPDAQNKIKNYLETIHTLPVSEELVDMTSRLLSKLRVSSEAQEGISAFYEKRDPEWTGSHKISRHDRSI